MQQELAGDGVHRHDAGEKHNYWREIKQSLLPTIKVGEHRGRIIQLLRKCETPAEQNALLAPHLHRTLPPAHALADEGRHGCWGEAEGQGLSTVDRFEPFLVQPDGRVQVFGNSTCGEAADRVERGATNHGATTAKECRIPIVLPALDN